MPAQLVLLVSPPLGGSAPPLGGEEQLALFTADAKAEQLLEEPAFSAAVGDAGEIIFQGICTAYGLPAFRAPAGYRGFDFLVNGHRVQVKATRRIGKDGRMTFHSGVRRFADYRDEVDFLALVYVGPAADFHGRVRILPLDTVLQRWRGSSLMLRPIDLPKIPDVSLLTKRE